MDSRVVVFDKPNSGVSDTRNFGIQNARGNYLMFVDADDVLADHYLDTIEKHIGTHDILLYRSCRDRNLLRQSNVGDSERCLGDHQKEMIKSVLYNRRTIDNCEFNFNRVTDYVIFAKIIKENSLMFDKTLNVGEDKIFNFDLFQKTDDVAYIDACLYYIRTNNGSVMGSYNSNALKINELLYKAFEEKVAVIRDERLRADLTDLMNCLGYQIVWNSITSDYCHKNNPLKYQERKMAYAACSKYLHNDAKRYLGSYDKYLLSVFQYPYIFVEIIMKNRLVRGAWYYICRIFHR
jgi:glycosyltransferase involved in cell wall biosynthesis